MVWKTASKNCIYALCLVGLVGCSSHRALVAKVSATTTYHVATYEHRCQNTDGHYPAECKACQAVINEAVWQSKVALTNRDQGYLPPEEVKDLKRLVEELSKCP